MRLIRNPPLETGVDFLVNLITIIYKRSRKITSTLNFRKFEGGGYGIKIFGQRLGV